MSVAAVLLSHYVAEGDDGSEEEHHPFDPDKGFESLKVRTPTFYIAKAVRNGTTGHRDVAPTRGRERIEGQPEYRQNPKNTQFKLRTARI